MVLAAVQPAAGHSASQGLHLHLDPDPAAPGGKVKVRIHAWVPMESLEIGFVGGDALKRTFRKPKRTVVVRLRVPRDLTEETVNCHAEARTVEGKTVRSSAILRLIPKARR
jgi:hypothetical protein